MGCSSTSSSTSPGATGSGTNGSGAATSGSTAATATTGTTSATVGSSGATTAGTAGATTGTTAATGGSTGATASATGATGGTSGGFANAAVCGERGSGTANATTYDGTAELYIIGDAGLGIDECTVKFDVKRVAAAPAGCTDCAFTHLVEYSNPMVITNTDGACDASDSAPQLDSAGRAQITGSRVGRGFSMLAGHGDQLMKYADSSQTWIAIGRASWDAASGDLGYDIRTGTCNYGH